MFTFGRLSLEGARCLARSAAPGARRGGGTFFEVVVSDQDRHEQPGADPGADKSGCQGQGPGFELVRGGAALQPAVWRWCLVVSFVAGEGFHLTVEAPGGMTLVVSLPLAMST